MIDPEVFKPIPGYEGIYVISRYGQIKHVKFGRFKNTTINKRGYEIVVLFKEGIPTTYAVNSLIKLAWFGRPIKKNKNHSNALKIKCETTNQTFDSYSECCKALKLSYRPFCAAMKTTDEYKGFKFIKINN